VHFEIDYSNRQLTTNSDGIATAVAAVQNGETKVQGAATIDNKYFLTQSGGSLITFTWQDGQIAHPNVFPSVAEDLSYDPGLGLWTLMEAPGNRHVFAIDHTKF